MAACLLLVLATVLAAADAAVGFNYSRYVGDRYYYYQNGTRPCGGRRVSTAYLDFSPFNRSDPLRQQSVFGNVTLTEDMDDTWSFTNPVSRYEGNAWLPLSRNERPRAAACSWVRSLMQERWQSVFRKPANDTGPCRLPAGRYAVAGELYPASNYVTNTPVVRFGLYRMQLLMERAGRVVSCSHWFRQIVPRE